MKQSFHCFQAWVGTVRHAEEPRQTLFPHRGSDTDAAAGHQARTWPRVPPHAYFMPESAIPSVMYRCRNRKMIMMGIDAIAAPAIISPWNDPFS